jgi:hypothetical protein
MPTYGGATSNSKVTVSHEGARSALGMQAHCAESALAASPGFTLQVPRCGRPALSKSELGTFTGDTIEVVADSALISRHQTM